MGTVAFWLSLIVISLIPCENMINISGLVTGTEATRS